jgi:hypothetical protein
MLAGLPRKMLDLARLSSWKSEQKTCLYSTSETRRLGKRRSKTILPADVPPAPAISHGFGGEAIASRSPYRQQLMKRFAPSVQVLCENGVGRMRMRMRGSRAGRRRRSPCTDGRITAQRRNGTVCAVRVGGEKMYKWIKAMVILFAANVCRSV